MVQGAALALMVANFIITLPGRASPLASGLLSVAGLIAIRLGDPSSLTPGILVALIPAAIAAFGGAFAGACSTPPPDGSVMASRRLTRVTARCIGIR
ncbi:MAG TPA: hypothetical protein VH277_15305 [Gemmatimonadaceae bacterium]|nr:hypothetical protein [Gemmatimonadaceae bacterium]